MIRLSGYSQTALPAAQAPEAGNRGREALYGVEAVLDSRRISSARAQAREHRRGGGRLGQPERLKVNVHQTLEHLVHEALQKSGNQGQAPSDWELRTEDGARSTRARRLPTPASPTGRLSSLARRPAPEAKYGDDCRRPRGHARQI